MRCLGLAMRERCGMRLRLVVAGLFVGLLGCSADAACLRANEEGQTVQGLLTSGRFSDAAGRPEQAFILQLAAPTCLDGQDEFDKVADARMIHVFSLDDALRKRLQSFVGKNVIVRGNPFGEHTAHHHAPIVMDISAVDLR